MKAKELLSKILITESNGKAKASVYWYADDNTTVYLAGLNVNKEIRQQGIGRKLQEIREQIGRNLGSTISCLLVDNNSWMYEWYKRCGYSDFKRHEHEENYVWMRKLL